MAFDAAQRSRYHIADSVQALMTTPNRKIKMLSLLIIYSDKIKQQVNYYTYVES